MRHFGFGIVLTCFPVGKTFAVGEGKTTRASGDGAEVSRKGEIALCVDGYHVSNLLSSSSICFRLDLILISRSFPAASDIVPASICRSSSTRCSDCMQ